jgi:hypothetical protein
MNEIFILHMKTFNSKALCRPLADWDPPVSTQFAVEGDGRQVPVQSSSE